MKLIVAIIFYLLPVFVVAQTERKQLDSLRLALKHTANDSVRMEIYTALGYFYDDVNLDSSVYYNEKGLNIAQQLNLKLNAANFLMSLSFPLTKMGNYPRALKVLMQSTDIAANSFNEKNTWHLLKGQTPKTYRLNILGYIHLGLGYLYLNTGNYDKALANYPEGIRIAESINDTVLLANMYGDMGVAYYHLNQLDSSLLIRKKALEYFSALSFENRKFEGDVFSGIGDIYQQIGNLYLARENYEKAVHINAKQKNPALLGEAYLKLAKLYQSSKQLDSSLHFSTNALEAFTIVGKEKYKAVAYKMISDIYGEQKNEDSSFAYLKLATSLNDSVDRSEKKKLQEYQAVGFNEQLRLQELEKERNQTQNNIRTYAMLAGIGVCMLIAFLLYRNNRNRRKANNILHQQKEALQSTLTELKSTQAQLIQSEKMASLGELTAGIAHEIQNPLNFVNNFSEVSNELIEEMNDELNKGDIEEAKAIATDIKQNLEKINHHGKRADAIVKGMLQHSQSSSGKKDPTNINKLADEYLLLAYHGIRAKDKSFNATLHTDFDESIGSINIVPQDIGRVILNLITNAFYAVQQKKTQVIVGYEPTVSISTKKLNNKITISVKDNGNGIPPNIIDKIFQPFFTTKPTGQGTGLGLSLAYDIVKAHGGNITVNTEINSGTTFQIELPVN